MKAIDELDISIQAKLLQVLSANTFSHSGIPIEDGVSPSPRVILILKNGSDKLVKEGHLYDDLFSKIHFASITVPPLRDRKEQMPSLSQYYFDFYKQKYGKEVSPFTSKLINDFKEYAWPGNIRELETIVKGIVIDGREDAILKIISDRRLHEEIGLGFYENSSKNSSMENNLFTLKDVRKKAVQSAAWGVGRCVKLPSSRRKRRGRWTR